MRHDPDYLIRLIQQLCRLPRESEWVEFKQNKADPEEIGEYISALANSAALNDESRAYLLWGVKANTHQILGTSFKPSTAKKGNEPLENWLWQLTEPKIEFSFHSVEVDEKPMVLLIIECTQNCPIKFNGKRYIRIGDVKKSLDAAPTGRRHYGGHLEQETLNVSWPQSR